MMSLDKFERFISNSFRNVGQGFYDSYVEANVSFRSKLGMRELVVRRQLGNCCKWCSNLAGIYEANNAPRDIYKRHRNCRCLVTYKTETGYQNVWNKTLFKTQKQARYQRLKEISEERQIENKYALIKRDLLAQGQNVYDATKEWYERATPKHVIIKELKKFKINNVVYTVDNKNVVLDLKPHEKAVLNKFVNTFGGTMEYCPRINNPSGIKTPDCLYNGKRYDLKQLGLRNPGCKGKNLLLNVITKKEQQSHCFIYDISRSGLSLDEAIEQAKNLFMRQKTKYVEIVVLYDGNTFKIFEKI